MAMGCGAADCMAGPYGGCMILDFAAECMCAYGCATDADCAEGSIALLSGPADSCLERRSSVVYPSRPSCCSMPA